MIPSDPIKSVFRWLRNAWAFVAWPVRHRAAPFESVDGFAHAVAHLEFLGYAVSHEPNGWSYAQHPYRYNFHLRAFPEGIRLDMIVAVRASPGNSRGAWLDFLNSANAQSLATRFSLTESGEGTLGVTMRALSGGGYSRRAFALLMDMWHHDVDQLRRQPDFTEPNTDCGDEVTPVRVN